MKGYLRHAEEIIHKLREADVLLRQGRTIAQALCSLIIRYLTAYIPRPFSALQH